ncbi:expressed unknown protein [Seminavis robusta]|uniref:SnoaL-like domain-containing protein n=1 Tax=Seminavis robusta TaxID=568900 RepID=A0A9N8H6A4_9STRA|nr:expressed unknown protein [Seminavis robusta]|eukprot:Sro140_g065450.1 n/a (213) ;mRNA; r:44446-45084
MKISKGIAQHVKGAKDKMLSLSPKRRMPPKAKGRKSMHNTCEVPSVELSGELSVCDPLTELRIATAEVFYACLNDHDLRGAKSVLADDVTFEFRALDGSLVHEMNWQDFREETMKIFNSFPDFANKPKSIREGQDGTVKVHYAVTSGTHSGTPFAFGPFPPIEASNTRVVNDPEDVRLTFCDGRIRRFAISARGEMVGPAGLYTQLGGFPLV